MLSSSKTRFVASCTARVKSSCSPSPLVPTKILLDEAAEAAPAAAPPEVPEAVADVAVPAPAPDVAVPAGLPAGATSGGVEANTDWPPRPAKSWFPKMIRPKIWNAR